MSYLGLVRPIFHSYVNKHCKDPKILEIGIDKGQSTLPIIQNLIYSHQFFDLACVDIKVDHTFVEQVAQLSGVSVEGVDQPSRARIRIYEENSVELLAKFLKWEKGKFDLVFIDGDHNYITVRRELELVKKLVKETGLIICDDFNGRWSERDLFYSERPGYENTNLLKRQSIMGKHGVKPAVTDFIDENPNWSGSGTSSWEPIIMYRSDVWKEISVQPHEILRDAFINFEKI